MGWILETITVLAVSLSQPLPTGNSFSLLAESWTYFWYLFLQEAQIGNELVPDSWKLTGYLLNAHSPKFKCRTQQSIFLVQVIVNTSFASINSLSMGAGGWSGIEKHADLMYVLCVRNSFLESVRSHSEEQWAHFIHNSILLVLPLMLIILA